MYNKFVKIITGDDREKAKRLENIINRISTLKHNLKLTDYKAIKYGEGLITSDEYAPIKMQRMQYREEINKLEEQLKAFE